MLKKYRSVFLVLLVIGVVVAAVLFLHTKNIAILNPKGTIASKERRLIITASLLSLIVVIPVFAMTFFIVWRYRESNTRARYSPDWDHNIVAETIWWVVPLILISILSVITWRSTHELDPKRPIASTNPPLTIQVVALQWKWLFIYPAQNVASVNYVQLPVNTPIDFEITADAPMNSFWIPQLGGQIYAMSGMSTHLHLMATSPGSFRGSSANISGTGFASMNFNVNAGSDDDFLNWLKTVKGSPASLTLSGYNQLATPSTNNRPAYYATADNNLYATIVTKFALPAADTTVDVSGTAGQHTDNGNGY